MKRERAQEIISSGALPRNIKHAEDLYIRKLLRESLDNWSFNGVLGAIADGFSEDDILSEHAFRGMTQVECPEYKSVKVFKKLKGSERSSVGQYFCELSSGEDLDTSISFDSPKEAAEHYLVQVADAEHGSAIRDNTRQQKIEIGLSIHLGIED